MANNADAAQKHPDTAPPSWLRGTADDGSEPAAVQAAAGDEAKGFTLDARTPEERRICELEAEVKEIKRQFGIVLEFLRLMVTETHTRKYHWDKEIYPFYKQYIEEKRKAANG